MSDDPRNGGDAGASRHTRLLRIAEHVRTQNWTAIGIDFLIVVLGVFVGIQVANWNAARVDQQRGADFTERLLTDLRDERWVYGFLIAYYSDVRAAADRAIGDLEGVAPLSNHDPLVAAYRATQYREGARRRDTDDELVSTGSMGLLADQDLLRRAAAIYRIRTIENATREGLGQGYRREFRMLMPNAVQRELARSCGDRPIEIGQYEGIDTVIDYPCTLDLSPAVIDAAAESLRADPEIRRALRLRIADFDTRLSDFTVNNRSLFESVGEVDRVH
jgi:hypothetical protein